MSAPSPAAAGAAAHARAWVHSMGGPLLAVPVSVLASWGGCTMAGMVLGGGGVPDDYDRACAVEGLAGAITVGGSGAQALVLADEPAASCYLPGHRVFLRWLAARTESGLIAAAGQVFASPSLVWEDCGTWTTDGPAILMDSVTAGAELGIEYPRGGLPEQAPVPLPAGTWTIRAVHTEADDGTLVGLVHLLPASPSEPVSNLTMRRHVPDHRAGVRAFGVQVAVRVVLADPPHPGVLVPERGPGQVPGQEVGDRRGGAGGGEAGQIGHEHILVHLVH